MNRTLLLICIAAILVGVVTAKRSKGERQRKKGKAPLEVPAETPGAAESDPEAGAPDAQTEAGTPPRRENKGKGKRPGKPAKDGRRDKPSRVKPNRPEKETPSDCSYSRPILSECDPETNRQNKTRRLIAGDPGTCQIIVTTSIRCNKAQERKASRRCDYVLGEYGPCNITTKRRMRIDTLSDPAQESDLCTLERTVYDRCSKKDCVYNWELSECDSETGRAVVIGSLVDVEGAPSICETTANQKAVKCKRGKAKCKFGEWGEFGECVDGIKTRTREMTKGGRNCEPLTKNHMLC